jgi:hypothetical protein
MFQFYSAGLTQATDPFEVAKVISDAIMTDDLRLRYPVSWGGVELIRGRAAMSDEDWISLGNHDNDDDYYDDFAARFGLDLRTNG